MHCFNTTVSRMMQTLFAHNSHLYCTIRYPSAQSLYAAALSIRITSNRKASALGQFWPILFSMFYYIFSRMHCFFFHLLQSTWIFYHIFINQKSIFCTKCAHAGKIRFFFSLKSPLPLKVPYILMDIYQRRWKVLLLTHTLVVYKKLKRDH